MAKDPVCGMFVEEKPDSITHMMNGKKYFFCSSQCLNEFREPEKELKKIEYLSSSKCGTDDSDYSFKSASHAASTVRSFPSDRLDA